jgi:hypothetical protein
VNRGHWPDCAVNHGPPDATCDMGPNCGTVTAETITDEQIRELFVHTTSDAIGNACRIALGLWKRSEGDVRRARERCAAAWNARHGGDR